MRQFAYFSLLIMLSWLSKGGSLAQCPPFLKYAPGQDFRYLDFASFSDRHTVTMMNLLRKQIKMAVAAVTLRNTSLVG